MGIAERKKREKEIRKKQIQDAAMAVFMNKDFHSVTIEDIANKAELSPATLYLYFKNKYELYASLHLMYLEDLHDQITTVYEDDTLTAEEKIVCFKDAMYNAFQNNPILLKIIFHMQLYDVLTSLDKKLLNKLNTVARNFMNMMASVYDDGVKQGKFKEGRGILHADILWAIFSGLVVWEGAKHQIDPKKDFLKPTLDRAFDIFYRGIKK
jgi:AcrR family transcriptional regulator